MTVYYCMISIMFIGAILIRYTSINNRIKTYDNSYKNKIIATLCFAIIIIVLGLRHQSMGYDLRWSNPYSGYLRWFEMIANSSVSSLPSYFGRFYVEPGYIVLNKILGFISDNRTYFIFACALISILPILLYVRDNSEYPLLSAIVFIGIPSFLMYYSAISQMIAVGLCWLALKELDRGHTRKFILIVLLATTIHASAIFFLLVIVCYKYKASYFDRLISIAILLFCYIIRIPLFRILVLLWRSHFDVEATTDSQMFWIFLLLYTLLSLYSIQTQKRDFDKELNIFFIAVFCLAFQDVFSLSARMSVNFMIILTTLIPKFIYGIKNNGNRKIIYFVFIISFLIMGLVRLKNGEFSYALSSPYHWFWESLSY